MKDYSGIYLMDDVTRVTIRIRDDGDYNCQWVYSSEHPWPESVEVRGAKTVARLIDGDGVRQRAPVWHRLWPATVLLPVGA